MGEVNQQGAFFILSRAVLWADYLRMAGGSTRLTSQARAPIRARGRTAERIVCGNAVESLEEWAHVLHPFGLGAAGFKVLK